jgi:hypothetical protein
MHSLSRIKIHTFKMFHDTHIQLLLFSWVKKNIYFFWYRVKKNITGLFRERCKLFIEKINKKLAGSDNMVWVYVAINELKLNFLWATFQHPSLHFPFISISVTKVLLRVSLSSSLSLSSLYVTPILCYNNFPFLSMQNSIFCLITTLIVMWNSLEINPLLLLQIHSIQWLHSCSVEPERLQCWIAEPQIVMDLVSNLQIFRVWA